MNEVKQSITFRLENMFLLEPGLEYGTLQRGSQKYLFVNKGRSIHTNDQNLDFLLVPDDDSVLANQIRNNVNEENVLFNTLFSNLKFSPNTHIKKKTNGSEITYHEWIVKDTSQVKKFVATEPPLPTFTFEVISQKKSEENEWGYTHELVIKPVSLEIENFPPITRLLFDFTSPPPGSGMIEEPEKKNLKKSKLYNSDILTNSVGGRFSMEIKVWQFNNEKEKKSGEYHYNIIVFHSDNEFVFDSFREIKETVSAEKPKDLPKLENKDNKSSNSQQEKQIDNESNLETSSDNDKGIANSTKILVGVGIILVIFGLSMVFWVYQKKNAKGKL